MLKPELKQWGDLNEADFAQHPAWTNCYEPDEMELLISLGFSEFETRKVLEAVAWSEEYAFPLPIRGASLPFKRLCVSARVTTSGGVTLVGYLAPAALTVFYRGVRYHFNRALQTFSERNAEELAARLGEKTIFPLKVELPALAETRTFNLAAT